MSAACNTRPHVGKLLGAMMAPRWHGARVVTSPCGDPRAVGALIGHFVVDREPVAPSLPPPRRRSCWGARLPPGASPQGRGAPKPKKISADDLLLVTRSAALHRVARRRPPVQMEIRVIREFFEQRLQFKETAMEAVRTKLKTTWRPEQDIEFLTTRARTAVKPSIRVEVVRSLYDLASSTASSSAVSRTCSSASSATST